ncbi:DUF1080 domain-containing protein [bacterium]|nr:DUF1080 domain-containing protein [bacterium]
MLHCGMADVSYQSRKALIDMNRSILCWVSGLIICGSWAGCAPTTTPSKMAPPLSATPEPETQATLPLPEPEPETPFELEPDFRLLSLADFVSFPAEVDTWTEDQDRLISSGKPRGYLYSKESFQNFTLKLDYKFPRPANLTDEAKFKGNTGFLIYITGEAKIWPLCLEVQGKHVQMAAIKENGGAEPPVVKDDGAAREAARKPVGQWNSLEIVSKDGALNVSLNGTPISSSEPNFLSSGSIGIQAEDFPFEVRHLRIRIDE